MSYFFSNPVIDNPIVAANILICKYNEVRLYNENPSDFYCGITKDPVRRMEEHNLPEGTFNWWVKTNCLETAQGTEEILDSNGFDCGKQIGNGDNDSVFVYIYRKSDKTKE